jgi:hypothetical protein
MLAPQGSMPFQAILQPDYSILNWRLKFDIRNSRFEIRAQSQISNPKPAIIMRIAETWNTPQYRVFIYTLETAWYVEFEAGPMKQGYKFSKEKFPGLMDVKNALTETFMGEVYAHFNSMFGSLKKLG